MIMICFALACRIVKQKATEDLLSPLLLLGLLDSVLLFVLMAALAEGC